MLASSQAGLLRRPCILYKGVRPVIIKPASREVFGGAQRAAAVRGGGSGEATTATTTTSTSGGIHVSEDDGVVYIGPPPAIDSSDMATSSSSGSSGTPSSSSVTTSSSSSGSGTPSTSTSSTASDPAAAERVRARAAARRREQVTYQASAIAATLGVGALAVGATYYRFSMHMADGAPFPWLDMACTLALVFGGVVGMEMYARWAHRALWHDFAPGWALHKSHHEPRTGPFEANDVYAIANAVPAMGLCLYGFLTPGLAGSLCFGAGLGITLFGVMYMFIHDGLVHKRFPVGPLADVPAMKRIVAAHKIHHTERYGGVPFGMFAGPQELEAIGAGAELDRLVAEMDAAAAARSRR